MRIIGASLIALHAGVSSLSAEVQSKPNVLFIAVDDLNDWIGCLGGNEQSITPNFDRLAASGMLFSNAHCVAPACNPSRTATMTGRAPWKSAVYANIQKMREVLPQETILPKYFSSHGYWAGGSGKMLHYFIDAGSWHEYFPKQETENPFPFTMYPKERPVSLPRGGAWQYVETDWGPIDTTDKAFGGDYLVANWVSEKLLKKHEKPFFLACGIYRPHEPWFVPKKYFDKFPLKDIKLPPGYKEDDLDDLPKAGKARGANRYFAHIRKHKQWKRGVQGYLASINFADTMLGHVLDSLEKGPNKDNTIVVLWSDHGWHLGEKQHWQKYTAWRATTRVPLMVKVPKEISKALPHGVTPGGVCDDPVSLLSIFPTLTELCDLPAKPNIDGVSIVPLLKNPMLKTGRLAVTCLERPKAFGLSDRDWRYIHYPDGSEELYYISKDPYEWNNLANKPEHKQKLVYFRENSPKDFIPIPKQSYHTYPSMKWVPFKGSKPPVSKPDGGRKEIVFINRKAQTIFLYRLNADGTEIKKARVFPEKHYVTSDLPGGVWVVKDRAGKILGHFQVGDRKAKGVIPAQG
ncbi:sulfatase [Verrucomicrobiaceae bacterium N1E253]|uniref:Sulfatase n=2 Tax=Oceaniferula marina TaxID=2748318 RepID=A0A851GBE6_9BACT|nr:sulfatase [Oceaniferula marina]